MEKKKRPNVVVGMSGGVDSSVSLLLLKQQGYSPVGVSLKYDVWRDPCNSCRENVCCSKESFAIAKKICKRMGVEHHIVNVSREFKKEVIDYFTRELKDSRTPSPCVFCNPRVKFKNLIEFADKIGAKFVATGHYARVLEHKCVPSVIARPKAVAISNTDCFTCARNDCSYQLLKAIDKEKDQTYSLSFLTQKDLGRTIFPLGDLTKKQVYEIAKKQEGFEIFEKRKQSQDFCFISGRSFNKFLEKEIGVNEGLILNTAGKVVGTHRGLHFYTIGQRKGIRLSAGPFFVVDKDVRGNNLVVSRNEKALAKKKAMLSPYNLISGQPLTGVQGDHPSPKASGDYPLRQRRIRVKIRSSSLLVEAQISPKGKAIMLKFSKPQKALTPGQVAVFYTGETCLGGGVIE